MKILRAYILADTLLLAAVGLGMAFIHPGSFPVVYLGVEVSRSAASLGLIAAGFGVLALVLWMSTDLPLIGDRRRLALGLSLANLLIAVVAFLQTDPWGHALGWSLVAAFLGLAAGLSWTGLRPRKPAEIAAEIAALKIPDEIRQGLLRQIEEAAAQEERNRLARDLHDSIKQQLFSINVGAAAAQERWERDPEGARKSLADVRRSAREAMVEMQVMLHQLRPEALGTAGLIEALREQCEALGYRTGAEVTLELGEPLPDDRMPPGLPETLFRIAQEMLANVARHARARRVRLWLGRRDEQAVVRIEDDGEGFEPGEASGMGLRNMKERAAALRGGVEIASAPWLGTWVEVSIPLLPVPVPLSREEISWLELWEMAQMITFASLTLLYRRMPFLQSHESYLPLLVIAAVLLRELFQRRARPIHPNVDKYMRHQSIVLTLLLTGYFWAASGEMSWMFLSILSIVLSVMMVQLYRVSEVRRFWRQEPPPLRLWMVLLMETGILLRLEMAAFDPRRFALNPAQATSLLLLGAGFIYVASLRPRLVGTLS